MRVGANTKVTIDYTLRLESGETVDSSEGGDPLTFEFGQGQIIPGLERELSGLEEGAQKDVRVLAEEGYGFHQAEAVQEVPLDRFPENITPAVGMRLMVRGPQGEDVPFTIVKVSDSAATLDFNHPLASQVLNFSVTVREVQAAGTGRIILPGGA